MRATGNVPRIPVETLAVANIKMASRTWPICSLSSSAIHCQCSYLPPPGPPMRREILIANISCKCRSALSSIVIGRSFGVHGSFWGFCVEFGPGLPDVCCCQSTNTPKTSFQHLLQSLSSTVDLTSWIVHWWCLSVALWSEGVVLVLGGSVGWNCLTIRECYSASTCATRVFLALVRLVLLLRLTFVGVVSMSACQGTRRTSAHAPGWGPVS